LQALRAEDGDLLRDWTFTEVPQLPLAADSSHPIS
jgi:hypothetical protein